MYWFKCSFYRRVVEDQATQMTLTGQEARIQIRYILPNHNDIKLFEQLCDRYKNQSKEQLQRHLDQF